QAKFSNLLETPSGNQPGSVCNESLNLSSQEVYPWAAPRVAEILSLCLRHFAIYAKALDGGITFIGGGSQIQELSLFVSGKLGGIKATRFKPSLKSLSAALNVTVDRKASDSVAGFEGLLEVSCEAIRRDLSKYPLFARGTPTFLRPLLSWFAAISN
ncbi:MAG: hypothetical protein NTV34_08850, partial [Proteobacteria bacterium]|nr:hypothetical protein [Pseudomonadota bacterium]